MKRTLLGLVGIAVAIALLAGGFAAGRSPEQTTVAARTSAGAEDDRAHLEEVIRDYLLQNPEILVEVQAALTARDQEAQKQQQLAVLQSETAAIYDSPYDAVIGNPDAQKTIVEFFDYNCGYCKHALEDMQVLVQADNNLRFVMKEFPILGPESQQAHVVSAAFKRLAPEKYADFHLRLLGGSGRANASTALSIATDLGVEEAALRQEMKNPAIVEEFTRTYELANKLAITGTPAYVIGDEVISGAIGADSLREKVEAARSAH